MVYRLALPPSLEGVHNVFHVSQLRRYVRNDSHVLDHSKLELRPGLSYTEPLMAILDRSVKVIKNRPVPLVLVSWDRRSLGEAIGTRECHSLSQSSSIPLISGIFLSQNLNFEDKIFLLGG